MVAPLASCYRKACRGRRSLGEGALTHLRAKAKNHYGGTEPRSREELPFLFFLRDSVSPWWVLIFLVPHNLFDSLQILFRVDADGVERRFCHVNRYSDLRGRNAVRHRRRRRCRTAFLPRKSVLRSPESATAPAARCARATTLASARTCRARPCDSHRTQDVCNIEDALHRGRAGWSPAKNTRPAPRYPSPPSPRSYC